MSEQLPLTEMSQNIAPQEVIFKRAIEKGKDFFAARDFNALATTRAQYDRFLQEHKIETVRLQDKIKYEQDRLKFIVDEIEKAIKLIEMDIEMESKLVEYYDRLLANKPAQPKSKKPKGD